MCVCTITAQQLELDLAHTLKTPSLGTPANDLFLPTEENFKAAVDQTLNDSAWFREWAGEIIESYTADHVEQCIEEDVRCFFNNNFNITNYVDIDQFVQDAFDNSDLSEYVNSWMDNNVDAESEIETVVENYLDRQVDVEEIADRVVGDILRDVDFIEALATEMLRQQAEQKKKEEALTLTNGETNASL